MAELKRTPPRRRRGFYFGDKFITPYWVVDVGRCILVLGDQELHMSIDEGDALHRQYHSETGGNVGALKAHLGRIISKKGETNREQVEKYKRRIAEAEEIKRKKTAPPATG